MTIRKTAVLAIFCQLIFVTTTQAQIWKKVQNTVENKANKKVDDLLNGKKNKANSTVSTEKQSTMVLEEDYSFTPGSKIIFESDFRYDKKGSMPRKWKSSGSGSVAAVAEMPGNWLALSEKTTYKIDSLFKTPGNFTVEFDIVTRSDETADIGGMSFGFARDNSISNHLTDAYNGNAITNTQLHFHNQEIINSSSDTKIYSTLKFPFANFANSLMHVSIAVEGETMSVFVNKSKVLDTKMFRAAAPKFFYITAPYSYEQGSKVYFGNLQMMSK
jgi:hypothetical protein